ncbi:DivIVA domain-containing protein [Actinoplanes tereljensis]|uniref:Cell wall synthesis protein Wag31 n=1 Tax=Paractinoplanes tereljensis TaxID=571912 RepID=A0A919NWJ2_9ACTN|nr:DivIVA domain-containing protein [Actinoplanes tereljensis]GIF26626.1 cell wall synthesis protein Wag31 [Actinoplanes tereljensis]
MPLTPAEIHNIEFAKASIGKRGYDEEQVDALLDEVSTEMIRLLEENDRLQRHLPSVSAPPEVDNSAATAEFSALNAELDRARRACAQAETNARRLHGMLDEARRSAAARPAPAPVADNSEAMLSMAQRTADDHMRHAHEESNALINEARERSERTTDEARKLAGDIESNARRHHQEAAAELGTKRAGLLREIDEMTEFIENYRHALRDHVTRQGQLLDGTAVEQVRV